MRGLVSDKNLAVSLQHYSSSSTLSPAVYTKQTNLLAIRIRSYFEQLVLVQLSGVWYLLLSRALPFPHVHVLYTIFSFAQSRIHTARRVAIVRCVVLLYFLFVHVLCFMFVCSFVRSFVLCACVRACVLAGLRHDVHGGRQSYLPRRVSLSMVACICYTGYIYTAHSIEREVQRTNSSFAV